MFPKINKKMKNLDGYGIFAQNIPMDASLIFDHFTDLTE